jgi:hypothetical protein
MFINDVGASSFEEVNDGIAGSNYGWPLYEGPENDPNFRGPVYWYPHGPGNTSGCAITGGAFYNPPTLQFPADYVGDYFFADLCNGWINRWDPVSGTNTVFATSISSSVDIKIGSDGSLFYAAINSGDVHRVQFQGGGQTEPVVWTALVGVTANGSTLTKTASSGWGNAGAVSTKALQSGNGYVEVTALERNSHRIFGLANGNSNNGAQDVEFGIHLNNNGTAFVREGGVKRGPTVNYRRNDTFRVAVDAGAVKYSQNGVVFYTSLLAPTYPLLVDTALNTQGSTIGSATISGTWSVTLSPGR